MSLYDEVEKDSAYAEVANVAASLESERKKHQATRRELAKAQERTTELEGLLERYATVKPDDQKVPKWLGRKPPRKEHHATPVLMFSDLHLDEVVDRYEMDGLNEYDRDIARARIERVTEGAIDLAANYVSGVELDGIMVPFLGDIVTGDIHDELARTNESPVPATIAHWVPFLASMLRHLADHFGTVHVPCVDGNHDRTYKRVPAKKRAESSNAWIIYNWMADMCRDDERITFGISTSPEQVVSVYDTRFLLSHGDGFRSSGGIGGIYPSMNKWLLRKHDMYGSAGKQWDYALIGHWHQLIWGRDVVVNGSTKGLDEYAKSMGFGFERPSQAMFIVTPENGIVQRMPVFAD